jgi:hypothetical protein
MPRRKREDPLLNRMPFWERKRQLYIRQQIAREYEGVPPVVRKRKRPTGY